MAGCAVDGIWVGNLYLVFVSGILGRPQVNQASLTPQVTMQKPTFKTKSHCGSWLNRSSFLDVHGCLTLIIHKNFFKKNPVGKWMERDFSACTDSSEKFAKQMESLKGWPCFRFPRCNVLNGNCRCIVFKVSLIQGLFSVYGTTDYQKEFPSPEFRLTIAKPRRLLPM